MSGAACCTLPVARGLLPLADDETGDHNEEEHSTDGRPDCNPDGGPGGRPRAAYVDAIHPADPFGMVPRGARLRLAPVHGGTAVGAAHAIGRGA